MRALFAVFLGLHWVVSVIAAESTATNRYEFRKEHSRDGIGKFYMGREISHVMGHLAADWLERPERDAEEHTEKLVNELKVKPGDARRAPSTSTTFSGLPLNSAELPASPAGPVATPAAATTLA